MTWPNLHGWKGFRVSLPDMQHVMQSCPFFLQGYSNMIMLVNCPDLLPGLPCSFRCVWPSSSSLSSFYSWVHVHGFQALLRLDFSRGVNLGIEGSVKAQNEPGQRDKAP